MQYFLNTTPGWKDYAKIIIVKRLPLVSVIVPTKNEETNITRCLRSVKQQLYKGDIEIIVVDNYSTDNTAKLAARFTPKILLVGKERSRQRNIGAKSARGTWLLFVDADMELSRNVISECIKISKNKVTNPVIAISEQSVGKNFWGKAFALEKNCYKNATWLHAARFFPRRAFLELGGYDEHLFAGEDWDITQRFRLQGFPLFIAKHSYLLHHERNENLLNLLKKERYYIQNIDRYAKKHPYPFSYQGSFLYRGFIWIRSWNELFHHPILTSAFLLYKFIVWFMWMWHKRGV